MPDLHVSLAGLTVAVELPHDGWLPPLTPRLGKFFTDRPADHRLQVVLDADLARAPGGEPRVEEDGTTLHLRHDNFHGVVPASGPAVLTIYQSGSDPDDLTYTMVVDSLLRLIVADLLAARGGIMFHAAGIAAPEGYVFFGPSGSGKTTVCRLSHPRFRILCDEIVAVRPVEGGYRLYGTPFAGAWGDSLAEEAPLTELFYLKQAPATRRVPLPPNAALVALMESAVVYRRSAEFTGRLMDAQVALLSTVPVTQLEFIPKESLWETIRPPQPTR